MPGAAMDAARGPGAASSQIAPDPHLVDAIRAQTGPKTRVLAADLVTLLDVPLPVRGQKARRAALPFAVEDRIAQTLDTAHVALCRDGQAAGSVLAAVVDRAVMDAVAAEGEGPVLPETLALPVPGEGGWTLYHGAGRVVVRTPDGAGFGTSAEALPTLWQLAGRPAVTAYGAPLPDGISATHAPGLPTPAPADMAVDLRQGAFAPASADWRPLARLAAVFALVAALGHLALAGADAWALGRIAAQERATAQAAVAPILPGVRLPDDPTPILARLAPSAAAPPERSAFLPLVGGVSEVLLAQPDRVSWRRLAFTATPPQVSFLAEASGLEALQAAQTALERAGFRVETGAATARDGGAEAEFTVTGGGA